MLKSQVSTMLVVLQVVNQVQETLLPILLRRPSTRRMMNKFSKKMEDRSKKSAAPPQAVKVTGRNLSINYACFEMDCQCFKEATYMYWLLIRVLLSVRSWVRRPSARPEPCRHKGRDGQLQPEAGPIRVDLRRLHGGVAAVRPRLPLFLRLPSCRIVRPDEQHLRNQGNRTLYCVLWLDFLERDHFMTRN